MSRPDEFVIGKSDFGIDAAKSSFTVKSVGSGQCQLDLEIHGDKSTYDHLCEQPRSPWSWTLYPPKFYVDGFQFASAGGKDVNVRIGSEEDHDKCDFALYMMNHNDVEITIRITKGRELEATGIVDLMGKRTKFRLHWTKKEKPSRAKK